MITTHKVQYRDGELRIGWASWDAGQYKERSIKYAYADSSGKISRGAPELPFDVLVDMLEFATDQRELDDVLPATTTAQVRDVTELPLQELRNERKTLSLALMRVQGLIGMVPWADWQQVYNQVGYRYEKVKAELESR